MKRILAILTLTLAIFGHAKTADEIFAKSIYSMPVEQAKQHLRDNFDFGTPEQIERAFDADAWAWQPTLEEVKQAFSSTNPEAFAKVFSCPATKPSAPNQDTHVALLYAVSFNDGTITCLLLPASHNVNEAGQEWTQAESHFVPQNNYYNEKTTVFLAKKTLNHVAAEFAQDPAQARNNAAQKIGEFNSAWQQQQFQLAQYQNLNFVPGRLNQIDLLIASVLGDSDIIDLQATEATGTLVLKPEYHSYSLANTTLAQTSASQATFSEVRGFVSSAKWLVSQGIAWGANAVGANTPQWADWQVQVLKELDKMELAITDNSNLLAARGASMARAYNAFSEVSSGFYLSIAIFALLFGTGQWLYKGFDREEKVFVATKGYPIALGVGFLLFMPFGGGPDDSWQSKYQQAEKAGYSLMSSWADALAQAAIKIELDSIANQAGFKNATQLTYAQGARDQAIVETRLWGQAVNACWARHENTKSHLYGQYGGEFLESNTNVFGSLQEKTNLFVLHYSPTSRIGRDTYRTYYQNSPWTLSFCANAWENYNQARVRSAKMAEILTRPQTMRTDEMASIIRLQYGLYAEWGFPSVLALPIIKHQLERAGKIPEVSEIVAGEDEALVRTFAKWGVYYMLPGAQAIASLASTALSPLSKVPYVGDLIVGGGGAAIAVFTMEKIMGALAIISIVLFGSLRLVIILGKIFIYHIATPFLFIAVLLNKRSQDDVMEFTSKVFATMLELPIFVFAVYILMSLNDMLSGVGGKFANALNTIAYDSGGGSAWDWLNRIDYYAIGAIVDVAMMILSMVLSYLVLFKVHEMILNVIQIKTETTLDNLAETAVNSARAWNSKI